MGLEEIGNYDDSEDEIDDRKHARLLENVLNLDNKQHVRKPTRTEPTLQISEFNLVKSITGNKGSIHVQDLTSILNKRASHLKLSKKLKSTEAKTKTLSRPLEKPQAERIRRTVAYDETRKQLDRWEPIVTSNRAATSLSFPLDTDTRLEVNTDITTGWRLKSDLEQELEKLEPKVETYEIDTDSKFPLTMEEMVEKREELAKLRRYQNYKEIKARMQNKIKSKKYRKIARREKVKQQMKDFELLQKTDPEEALKKLEEIEKARAEERVSLRHKSTGKWAKNLQVRAKYDKESRQVLAHQLSLSKDLTQKIKVDESSDSEPEEQAEPAPVLATENSTNPWIGGVKTSHEVTDFISGYRKFWEQENKKQEVEDLVTESIEAEEEVETIETSDTKADREIRTRPDTKPECENVAAIQPINKTKKRAKRKKVKPARAIQTISDTKPECENVTVLQTVSKTKKMAKCKKGKKPLLKERENAQSEWDVSVLNINSETYVDDVFDDLEFRLKNKAQKQYSELKRRESANGNSSNKKIKLSTKEAKKPDLSLHVAPKKAIIDEELNETDGSQKPAKTKDYLTLQSILENPTSKPKPTADIDPNKFINVKPIHLATEIPDLLTTADNEENVDQQGAIAEAFRDDDIVDEFRKEKKDEIDKDKPADISLALPGWGTWGGQSIKMSKRKTKKFMLKFPKEMPRRDKNKRELIINEKANRNMKNHLVSDLPFPFKTVKDFEASMRAPISNTFVPERAFRRLIKPAITTKLGAIIEPMTEDVLIRKKKRKSKD